MKIISYNVNGIRAALKKGLAEWIENSNPDILCIQEIKANEADIDKQIFHDLGYDMYILSAEKKGYSGVAILSKIQPENVVFGINEIDKSTREGRMIVMEFNTFSLINTYFPSGTQGSIRQDIKYQFLDEYQKWIDSYKKNKPNIICAGDYNIAHTEIDIHNPISNKNSSGFLPQERAWLSKHLESGFIDTFRHKHPDKKDAYSWWSFRANARTNNKGWRIDYILSTDTLTNKIADVKIMNTIVHSDHCPISLSIDI